MTADTPSPPKDSLYSLHPTMPWSVLILRKSKLRWPALACNDSTLVIFIVLSFAFERSLEHSSWRLRRPQHGELALELGHHARQDGTVADLVVDRLRGLDRDH